MEISAPARARLKAAMEGRVAELGLTWREVGEAAGGLSTETLRAVRRDARNVTSRTRRSIERGLRWQRGYVDQLLDETAAPVPPPSVEDLDAEIERRLARIRKRYGDDVYRQAALKVSAIGAEELDRLAQEDQHSST